MLWNQLNNAINLRNAQDQVLWSIIAVFLATNSILLVALFQSGSLPSKYYIGIVISAFGVALNLVWNNMQSRALRNIKRHEDLIETIEQELKISPDFATSPEIATERSKKYQSRWPEARTIMPIWSIVIGVFWLVALIFFIMKRSL